MLPIDLLAIFSLFVKSNNTARALDVFISSFTQEGIKELKDMLWASLQKDIEPEEQAVVLFPGDDNEQVID